MDDFSSSNFLIKFHIISYKVIRFDQMFYLYLSNIYWHWRQSILTLIAKGPTNLRPFFEIKDYDTYSFVWRSLDWKLLLFMVRLSYHFFITFPPDDMNNKVHSIFDIVPIGRLWRICERKQRRNSSSMFHRCMEWTMSHVCK